MRVVCAIALFWASVVLTVGLTVVVLSSLWGAYVLMGGAT